MCQLCSGDEKERVSAMNRCSDIAYRLRLLAASYDRLGTSSIKPHGDQAKAIGTASCNLIRDLVEDWV